MASEIIGGDHSAVAYNGLGSGLISIPRSVVSVGGLSQTVFTNSSGKLTSGVLPLSMGGTGIDASAITGVIVVNNGVSSAQPCTTTATANALVRRDGSAGITCGSAIASTIILSTAPTVDSTTRYFGYDTTTGLVKFSARIASALTSSMLRTTLGATQNIPVTTDTTIQFTAASDSTLTWNATTFRWTVATAGVYFVSACLEFVAGTSTLRRTSIVLIPSGGTAQTTSTSITAAAGSNAFVSTNQTAKCAVGDVWFVQAYTTTANNITTNSQITFVKLI